jgi:hypothetical protein
MEDRYSRVVDQDRDRLLFRILAFSKLRWATGGGRTSPFSVQGDLRTVGIERGTNVLPRFSRGLEVAAREDKVPRGRLFQREGPGPGREFDLGSSWATHIELHRLLSEVQDAPILDQCKETK